MRIQDFEGVYDADEPAVIDDVLKKRYGNGVNAFWLSHGVENYPAMVILVNQDLASLHYFPEDGHPGFRSVGMVEGLEPGGFSKFYMNSLTEEEEVFNDSIVPFSNALAAAKEFLISRELPASLKWLEL